MDNVYTLNMNSSWFKKISLSVAIFALPSGLWAASLVFSRDLRLGDTGSDVRALQVLLNQSAETRVASSGAGSPGQESDYFGARTAAAVKRFQELHRTEILAPAGLSTGTGYFGPATRAYIAASAQTTSSGKSYKDANKEFLGQVSNTQAQTTGTQKSGPHLLTVDDLVPGFSKAAAVATSTSPLRPRVSSIEPTLVTEGTVVTIKGTNFSTSSNRVFAFFAVPVDVVSPDGTTLTFTYHFTQGITDTLKTMSAQNLFASVGTNEIFQIATEYGVASVQAKLNI